MILLPKASLLANAAADPARRRHAPGPASALWKMSEVPEPV